jgi:hypothetical protein
MGMKKILFEKLTIKEEKNIRAGEDSGEETADARFGVWPGRECLHKPRPSRACD